MLRFYLARLTLGQRSAEVWRNEFREGLTVNQTGCLKFKQNLSKIQIN